MNNQKPEGILTRVYVSIIGENYSIVYGREYIRTLITSPENSYRSKIIDLGTVLELNGIRYKVTKINVAFHEKTYPASIDGINVHALDEQLDHGCDLYVSVVHINSQQS